MNSALPDHVRDLFWRIGSEDTAARQGGTAIGSDGGGTFLVDDHGAVHWESSDGLQPGRFVNASVDSFAVFLVTVGELRDAIQGMPEDSALPSIHEARDAMQSRDPTAFANDDTWWSVVFEQIEGGLL